MSLGADVDVPAECGGRGGRGNAPPASDGQCSAAAASDDAPAVAWPDGLLFAPQRLREDAMDAISRCRLEAGAGLPSSAPGALEAGDGILGAGSCQGWNWKQTKEEAGSLERETAVRATSRMGT